MFGTQKVRKQKIVGFPRPEVQSGCVISYKLLFQHSLLMTHP